MVFFNRKTVSNLLIITLITALCLAVPFDTESGRTVHADQTLSAGTVDIEKDLEQDKTLLIYNDAGGQRIIAESDGSIITSASAVSGLTVTGESTGGKAVIISGKGTGTVNVTFDGLSVRTTSTSSICPVALSQGAIVDLNLKDGNTLISESIPYAALQVSSPCGITISGKNEETDKLTASTIGTSTITGAAGAGIGGSNDSEVNSVSGFIHIASGVNVSALSYSGAGIGGGYEGEGNGIRISGGRVTAVSNHGAGIGGGNVADGSDITISGGNVDAVSIAGAGIGGGNMNNGSNIRITGGRITTKSSTYGAGIGGGYSGSGFDIGISEGNVHAQGFNGAAIGGGALDNGYDINISGGNVTAKGTNGAAIGGGANNEGKNINISGGTINAEATNGAAIGGGQYATGSGITISGGFVKAKSLNMLKTLTPSNAIGSGALPFTSSDKSSNIKILSGSVVAEVSTPGAMKIGITPTGISSRDVFEIDIPTDTGIGYGNTAFSIDTGTGKYNGKTVKDKPDGEHGEDYEYLATVYLPKGKHLLSAGNTIFKNITVAGDGTYEITEGQNPNPPPTKNEDLPVKTVTTSIKTAQKNIYLKRGQSITLPLVEYTNTGKKTTLNYKSSKKKIATVTKKGKVKAKKKGRTVITVKSTNGKILKFTVYVAIKAINVKKIKLKAPKSITRGKPGIIKVTISPKNATKAIATFKSNNPDILSVDKAGKLTAKKKGTAKITIKADGKKKVITIKVR